MEYKYSTINNSGKTYDIEFSAANIPKDIAEPIMSSIRRNIAKLEELNVPAEFLNKLSGPEEKVQAFKDSERSSKQVLDIDGNPMPATLEGREVYDDPILKR